MRPKDIFLASPYRKPFEDIAQAEAFRVALDYALLTMVERQSLQGTVNENWDAHSQIVGARKFIEILRNLHLTEPTPRRQTFENLKRPNL